MSNAAPTKPAPKTDAPKGKTETEVPAPDVKDEGQTADKPTDGGTKKAPQPKGDYTILEEVEVTVPGEPTENGEPTPEVKVKSYVIRGEVKARSKNDAIRQAYNESVISGQGTFAAVTTRSFQPVKVEPKVRTALSWS